MIGILGLQGDYAAHGKMLDALAVESRVVKKPDQLSTVDGLIFPGGESTTLIKLMDSWEFWAPLREFAAAGNPIFGTCAGMILLAQSVSNPPQKSLGLIDIDVERNSYGRQVDSFEGTGVWAADEQPRSLPMIFIRAPRIARLGDEVAALATCGDDVVVARQGQVLVASFHPELASDLSLHRYFVDMVERYSKKDWNA